MRKRNHRVQFMLNDIEYLKLKRYAAKSGLKIAGYLRLLVNGYVPKELPPLDYYKIMNQLYRIAGQIDQMKYSCNDPLKEKEYHLQSEAFKQMIIKLHRNFFDNERIT